MIQAAVTQEVVVLQLRAREAGSFTADDGRQVDYAGGLFMYFVPFGVYRGSISNRKVNPQAETKIEKIFEAAYPGTLAQITTDAENTIIDAKLVQK